jgi:hypothetical protein
MIEFRCWYCNKRYVKREERFGERFTCSCEHLLRVPKRSGGNCRVKTPVDWLVETVVYGGGGAAVGFGLAVLIIGRLRMVYFSESAMLIPALTLAGFVAGLVGGERGMELIGRMIREREKE